MVDHFIRSHLQRLLPEYGRGEKKSRIGGSHCKHNEDTTQQVDSLWFMIPEWE
jgi:hypothetical protein